VSTYKGNGSEEHSMSKLVSTLSVHSERRKK
jgi:hypothetical protein